MKGWLLYAIFTLCCYDVMATHIIGGEMTYSYLGAVSTGSGIRYRYKVTLNIYEDCKTGNPLAIAADNPAIFGLFDGNNNPLDTPEYVYFDDSILVPDNFNSSCITNPPEVCVIKKTFEYVYALPANSSGYIVAYQRCCRNATVVNIVDPNLTGSTYFCRIPPPPSLTNNSAVFKNYPPLIICDDNPLIYDHSATDTDGDSLSYAFCESYIGANMASSITPPSPPFEAPVSYVFPFTYLNPISGSPAIAIDPVTGIITGTPSEQGRYLISVACIEWRHGVAIDTVRREFQFVVTACSKKVVASIPQLSTDPNTYIVDCNSFNVFFENTSNVGTPDSTFHWSFGVPGSLSDTSDEYEPTFTYPDTGTYIVTLTVNPNTTCSDSIWRYVKVYPYFSTHFTDSGKLCPGSPVDFIDQTISTIKPITYWNWDFGDGVTSAIENPVHTYNYGGIYNVMLVSQNVKKCIDTIVKQVLVDNFVPFAGDDTIIVKGQSVYFNAAGGVSYLWSPAYQLSDTNTNNPVGYYPDTGTFIYYVYISSLFGCSGYDSISVKVVNQSAFFVPTAFTPNGDGKNDIFRPLSIGYRSLNYLRIFDRWGEEVYYGNSLKEGEGWDGTFKNRQAELGVYFWELSFTDIYGTTRTLK